MNSFKKLSVGALIVASLALSACAQDVPSADNPVPADPAANVSTEGGAGREDPSGVELATEAPNDVVVPKNVEDVEKAVPTDVPTLSPEESKEYNEAQAANPLGINIDESFEKYADPEVAKVFPEADFDTKEGVRQGLEFYQGLTRIKNFYDPRVVADDWNLIAPISDKIEASSHEAIQKDIEKVGRFYWMPTVGDTGTFGEHNGVNLDPVGMPLSTWNEPAIGIGYTDEMGNFLTITGKRNISFGTETGDNVVLETVYTLSVAPSGDGTWIVNQMGWELESVKVNGE